MKRLLLFLLIALPLSAQINGPHRKIFSVSVTPITLDASCTGHGTTQTVSCSAAMTVTAGDTITCEGFVTTFSTEDAYITDPINGVYDTVYGNINGANANNWVISASFANSASGSITPNMNATNGGASEGLACQAWKGTPTSDVVDGLATISQATSAANPTAGTAVAPANASEVIICALDRSSAATTTAGTGFTPSGTLTAVTQSFSHYFQYMIQTTATAENCPFTSASVNYVDTQFAVENASNPAGYRPITGMFGFSASSQTNGATITTTILNTQNSGSAWSTHGNTTAAPWTNLGTGPTWDTSVNPTGTGRIIAQGFPHTFGDAGGSIFFSGTLGSGGASDFSFSDRSGNQGQSAWLSYFFRAGSSGVTNTTVCDMTQLGSGATTGTLTEQAHYDTTNHLQVYMEDANSGTGPLLTGLSLDTDYWLQAHLASVNERYHQIIVYSKSGSTWSQVGSTNYDVLCSSTSQTFCATPTFSGSGTGTATSGSTSLTITSATGTPAVGNVVYPTTGIAYLTAVEAISGTCSSTCTITLSQNTTAIVSGTVNFVAKPTTLVAATNGTASAGSTALTIVVPSSGTPAIGDPIGSTDGSIEPGTYITAVSGTAVTMSQGAHSAVATGVTFWSPASAQTVTIGKWSSCSFTNPIWYSGLVWDPYGSWGAFAPN
jgi:hypothetical protein